MVQDMPPVVAGLDLGGTKTAAALVDRTGRLLDRVEGPTPGRTGSAAVLATAVELVQALESRSGRRIEALGVGSAGVIASTGVVLGATDVITDWVGTDLAQSLRGALTVPTKVRNDVHAHALGEARYGHNDGSTDAPASLLYVAVGTGIGAAFIHDDLPDGLLLGAHAAAGHAGHIVSPHARDLPCSCGARGHLEAIASGPALTREFTRRSEVPVNDLRQVANLAADGDQHAMSVIVLGGEAVGTVLGGLVNLFDPEVVVVGGGVTGLGATWWRALREAAQREVLPSLRATPVRTSALGVDAALLGAAGLAWDLVDQGVAR